METCLHFADIVFSEVVKKQNAQQSSGKVFQLHLKFRHTEKNQSQALRFKRSNCFGSWRWKNLRNFSERPVLFW